MNYFKSIIRINFIYFKLKYKKNKKIFQNNILILTFKYNLRNYYYLNIFNILISCTKMLN